MPELPPGWEAILGAGAAGAIAAGYKAFKDWRESKWKREDSAIASLQRWQRDADRARVWEARQHAWWRRWALELERVIILRLGMEALPTQRPYPKHPDDEAEESVEVVQ